MVSITATAQVHLDVDIHDLMDMTLREYIESYAEWELEEVEEA